MNNLARIGHNSNNFAIGADTVAEASKWLANNPVIETEDDAREAAKYEKRLKASFDELEAERDGKVRPLNDQVKAINEEYKSAQKPITEARNAVKNRLTAYALEEEQKRLAEARKLAALAAEAERIAREAEEREREAKDNAAQGEVGVDVIAATTEADQAFSRFKKADHAAAIAAKDSTVRIGTGWGRAASLRTKEILSVSDAHKAFAVMGLSDNLREALLTDARAYRKQHGKLPEGITSETKREM